MEKSKQMLKGLERFNVERKFRKRGVDVQEVDYKLTSAENLKKLQLIAPKPVIDQSSDFHFPDFPFLERFGRLVKDCKKLIQEERRSIKKAKYELGKRILEDENFLTREYGSDYFGKLAKEVNEKGYGKDQLYKCVKFAKHPLALEWLENHTVTWEKIRTEKLCGKLLEPIKFNRSECPPFITDVLMNILEELRKAMIACSSERESSEHREFCESNCHCMAVLEVIDKEIRRQEQAKLAL